MLFRIFCAFLLAGLMAGCKPTIKPEPVPEPDTVRSYVRAIVTAPGKTNELWEVRRPDTLSDGIVGVLYTNGAKGTRQGESASSYIDCFHNTIPQYGSIRITIRQCDNLLYTTVIGPQGQQDSLRTWNQNELSFAFYAPEKIMDTYELS